MLIAVNDDMGTTVYLNSLHIAYVESVGNGMFAVYFAGGSSKKVEGKTVNGDDIHVAISNALDNFRGT